MDLNMPSWWDWAAVAAIGQCLGAVATFAAVLVALSADRRSRITRLAVKVMLGQSGKSAPTLIIHVTNCSGRPVFLDGGSIALPDRRVLGPLPDQNATGMIRDSEKRELRIPVRTVAEWLRDAGHPRETRLRFVIGDTTGGEHACHYQMDPTPWLQKVSRCLPSEEQSHDDPE